jgi:uncharacterized protein (TIGR02145 family)
MTNQIIVIIMALCYGVLAQSINLTGTVTNTSNSQPLKGVVVTLKNTPALIDTTKADGTYQITGTVGVTHYLSSAATFSGSRFQNGILEIGVTKQGPVTVEAFGLNGVLKARLVHDMMGPGLHKVDIRSFCTNSNLCLIKVRQGDKTTVYPILPLKSSFTNSTTTNKGSVGLGKSEAFKDTLIFTMSGFTTRKFGVSASTGVNDIALVPLSPPGTITDADGNVYTAVTIGTQVWMVENLKTTHCNDGTAIPLGPVDYTWQNLTSPAYCWYNNDIANKTTYGALYNGYAVGTSKLAPTGWHVPSDSEWSVLVAFAGGDGVAGGPLKDTGTTYWQSPNTGATNAYGFSALPGGYRDNGGVFRDVGSNGHWWSSTANGAYHSWGRSMYYSSADVYHGSSDNFLGFSVRCIKN